MYREDATIRGQDEASTIPHHEANPCRPCLRPVVLLRSRLPGQLAEDLMSPQNKTLALFAAVGYVVSVPLSRELWGTGVGAWILLLALVPCAIAIAWVKVLFLRPRLQTVPGFLRGGVLGLLSYLSFGLLMAGWYSFRSSGLRETLWYFLIAGTLMFGLPLMAVGAATGFAAEKLFGKIRPSPPSSPASL
jgi:hypothetical protein